MILRCMFLLLCIGLAACQPNAAPNLVRGAGLELSANRAQRHVTNLDAYIDTMCVAAGLAVKSGGMTRCTSNPDETQYQALLQAGFGEISLGCRGYIQFVFEERLRDDQFRKASSSVQSFISGILTLEGAGSKLFSYLILGSGAANTFYDVTRLDPLRGMSTENILRIVTQRQSAFEAAAVGRRLSSRSQLVRLWHEYQWICSPLSISSDFNTLAIATLENRKVDFAQDASKLVSGIAQTQAGVQKFDPNKGLLGPKKSAPDQNALGLNERALGGDDIGTLQEALCQKPTRRFDSETRKAITAWRTTVTPNLIAVQLNEGLSYKEIQQLLDSGNCTSLGYKTVFERAYLHDAPALTNGGVYKTVEAERTTRFDYLMKILNISSENRDSNRLTKAIRLKIEEKRKEFGLPPGDVVDADLLKKHPQ
ncbi:MULTISPECIES: hypothetical protein [Agrobacterium]|nr:MULTISPECIES: hypothetical protein [Agrobacterium]KVK40202.1 hypothetical protein L903_14330 [Agrobacterium sp. JL28]KVK54679.1 hypothetical protein L906_14280 [Agrobacterium sp. TS45]KVK57355.1 hypothetical protein L907_14250 [Agrobacterium sp. C13]